MPLSVEIKTREALKKKKKALTKKTNPQKTNKKPSYAMNEKAEETVDKQSQF